ncbi:MAG: cation transporter [Nitrososphaerota archaeon]|nr:cation transporter [Nitrososphaerota archaeon]
MATRNVELKIFGMTCDDCAKTVTQGLKSKEGVREAVVDFQAGTAKVVIEDATVSPDDLVRAMVFGPESHYKALVKRVD